MLPNLIKFIQSAAGPTADIGVCSLTCIRTNLRTTATAVGKLYVEQRWLMQKIHRVQRELAAMFADPSSSGHDSVEQNSADGDSAGAAVADDRPAQASERLSSHELCDHTGQSCNNVQSETVPSEHLVNNYIQEYVSVDARWTCSVERVLRMRDELAVLRRRLYLSEVKQSFLRHSYSCILLPAAVHASRQLTRRSWRSIRHHRLGSSLRLRSYRDYVSGWDMGS